MPVDVSQFIQLQRLRSFQGRRPSSQDKTITHLYQNQLTSTGIVEFLPNIKDKNTLGLSIQKYYYYPGLQTKPKIPGGYVQGYDSNTIKISEFQRSLNNLISNFTNIANANSFFSGLDSLLQNGPKSLVNISSPTITAYYSSLGIPNVPSVIYGIAGTLFQTNFLDYASSLSDPGNPAGIIIPAAYPITIGVDIYQAVPPPTNQLTIYNMISATTTTLSAGSNFSVNGLTFRFLGAGSPGLCVIVY